MFIREKDTQQLQQLCLFELNKQIEYLRLLLHRNLNYQDKLRQLKDRLGSRLKLNEQLEKGFSRYRRRPDSRQRPISGINMYDYDTGEKTPTLILYKGLKLPRNKERLFIRSIFLEHAPELPDPSLAKLEVPLKEMVKSYTSRPSSLPFHLIGQVYHCTGLEVFRAWRALHPVPETKGQPTAEEERQLLYYYSKYKENWVQISVFTDDRTPEQLYYHFHRAVNARKNKGRWQLTENLKLVILVEYYGRGKWYEIYKVIRTRSDVQIRQKFCNILDPRLVVNYWTFQQQNNLIRVAKENDFKWSYISKMKLLGNKTDNEIWRKFRSLMHDKSREEIEETIDSAELRERIYQYQRTRSQSRSRKQGGPSTTSSCSI